MEHDIKLTTDTPVRVKQYPLPYSMMQAVNDEVRSMIELGVIERSESPYCSPVIIVKKKDNTNRFCIDFRVPVTCLNDYLVSAEAFPPRSEYRS